MNEAQYFEQFSGIVFYEPQNVTEAAINIAHYKTNDDQTVVASIQYIQRHASDVTLMTMRRLIIESLGEIKWDAHFIYDMRHDMDNPGVNADYALRDLAGKWTQ